MNIIDIFHYDDLVTVIRKCNENFRQLAWNTEKTAKLQNVDVTEALADMQSDINDLATQTIPSEVAAQVTAANIPNQVSREVVAQMANYAPPVGSYIIAGQQPSYTGTTWQQAGNVYINTSDTLPIWQRVS